MYSSYGFIVGKLDSSSKEMVKLYCLLDASFKSYFLILKDKQVLLEVGRIMLLKIVRVLIPRIYYLIW